MGVCARVRALICMDVTVWVLYGCEYACLHVCLWYGCRYCVDMSLLVCRCVGARTPGCVCKWRPESWRLVSSSIVLHFTEAGSLIDP